MKTKTEIAEELGYTREELHKLCCSFEPQWIMSVPDYDDENCGSLFVFYTDGDGGQMLFESYCEIFESEGVSMTLIDCAYCDISFDQLQDISQTIRDIQDDIEKIEEEKVCRALKKDEKTFFSGRPEG